MKLFTFFLSVLLLSAGSSLFSMKNDDLEAWLNTVAANYITESDELIKVLSVDRLKNLISNKNETVTVQDRKNFTLKQLFRAIVKE